MRVSILTPDLSHNCLSRAYLLAKLLQRRYEVEIVGPIFGRSIWKPLTNDKDLTFKYVKISGRLRPYLQINDLAKKIRGDVIYASKPLFTSFGVGILQKLCQNKPLVLDIDDWQSGLIKHSCKQLPLSSRLKSLCMLYRLNSSWNSYLGEKLIRIADKITVSSRFLQTKFSGEIIWHARDTTAFDPKQFDKDSVREKYGISKSKKVLMFLGTPRPHKGLEDVIEAIRLLEDKDVLLVVVGIQENRYCQHLVKLGKKTIGERFRKLGLQPFEKVPEFLAAADVVVIPQRKSSATIGQVPAKVFDAMAMAKPILSTNVSDLPEILEGCGWIVEPGRPRQLGEALQHILNNPKEADEAGHKARQRCIAKYSFDAMEGKLAKIFESYEKKVAHSQTLEAGSPLTDSTGSA